MTAPAAWSVVVALVGINLLWSANPVMTKFALEAFSPAEVAWLRMLSATIALAVAMFVMRKHNASPMPFMRARTIALAVLGGAVVFFITPLLAINGLERSLAIHSAFITGLEPVSTILLACLVLGERMRSAQWLILGVAVVGFVLLSGSANEWMGIVAAPRLVGNSLLLLATVGESIFSVIGGSLVRHARPATILLIALGAGALLLTLYVAPTLSYDRFQNVPFRSWLAILWIGPVVTAFCYSVWLSALRDVPVSLAAFTLFVQPVVGGFLGHAILRERPSSLEWAGGALILLALALHCHSLIRGARRAKQAAA